MCHALPVTVWVIVCLFSTFLVRVLGRGSCRLRSSCLPSSYGRQIWVWILIIKGNWLRARHLQSCRFLNYRQLSLLASRLACFVCMECGPVAFMTERWPLARGRRGICWWIGPRLGFCPRCRFFLFSHFLPNRLGLSCSLLLFMNSRLCFWFPGESWKCNGFGNCSCLVCVMPLYDYFILQKAFEVLLLHFLQVFLRALWQWRNLWSLPGCSFGFNYFRWGDRKEFRCRVQDRKWRPWFGVHIWSWFPDKVLKSVGGWALCTCNRFAHRSLWKSCLHRSVHSKEHIQSIHQGHW